MCPTNTSTSLSATLQNLVTWSCKTNDLWCLRFAHNCILVHIFYWCDSFGLMWTCILLCFQFLKTDQFIFSEILQGHIFLYTYIWNVELVWFLFSPLCFNIQRLTFFEEFSILDMFVSYTLLTVSTLLVTLLFLHCLLQWFLSAFVAF